MYKLLYLLVIFCFSQHLYAQIQVTDDIGRLVTLQHSAKRIVTLSPHSAELVVAAGAAAQLVGVAMFNGYPPPIRELPVVSHFSGLDREQLLMLQPDLVVAWASGNKPNDIAWLTSVGIPVYLSEPAMLEDIPASIEKLGHLSNHAASASQAARQFRSQLANSCPQRDGKPSKAVYYEIWPSPPMTIGGSHWLNQILAIAGLHNVFADQKRQIISVTPEALLKRPVEIKISSFPAPDSTSRTPKLLRGNDLLARPGPKIIQGLRLLCQQL